MRYAVEPHASGWETLPGDRVTPLRYSEAADRVGNLLIDFASGGVAKQYRNPQVNIPLFLAELRDLLDKARQSDGIQRWYLGMAPFGYARMAGRRLLVSSRSGSAFADAVYDEMAPGAVDELQARLEADMARYGRLAMAGGD